MGFKWLLGYWSFVGAKQYVRAPPCPCHFVQAVKSFLFGVWSERQVLIDQEEPV